MSDFPALSAPKKRLVWPWVIVGFVLCGAAGVLAAHLLLSKITQDHVALESRVTRLEAQFHTSQNVSSQPETAQEITEIQGSIHALEAQLAHLQSDGGSQEQANRKILAVAIAFDDLRASIRNGEAFTAPLALLRANLGADPALAASVERLTPYAESPPPTLARLRENLMDLEPTLPVPIPSDSPSWEQRVQKLLTPLLTIRPLRDPRLKVVEDSLAEGNALGAREAFHALPEEVRQRMEIWQSDLEKRIALDAALHVLTDALMREQKEP